MSHPLRSSLPAAAARHPDLSIEGFVQQVLDLMTRDDGPVVPYCRMSQICPPFSRAWIHERIRDGSLEAVRLRGLVLIPRESVRKLLESAEPWVPGPRTDRDGKS